METKESEEQASRGTHESSSVFRLVRARSPGARAEAPSSPMLLLLRIRIRLTPPPRSVCAAKALREITANQSATCPLTSLIQAGVFGTEQAARRSSLLHEARKSRDTHQRRRAVRAEAVRGSRAPSTAACASSSSRRSKSRSATPGASTARDQRKSASSRSAAQRPSASPIAAHSLTPSPQALSFERVRADESIKAEKTAQLQKKGLRSSPKTLKVA